MKKLLILLMALSLSATANAAGLAVKTKVLWVGQFANDNSFYFAAEDYDPTCSYTSISGHYRVEGRNSMGIYAMLLAAASKGKFVSFSIAGCHANGRALIDEMYYHAN
jgi:hypothetical protein